MHPDTLLSVELGAIIGHDKYTRDPDVLSAKIAELRARAGIRTDILDREVGSWIGYYDSPESQPLVTALLAAFPGAVPHIRGGQERRHGGAHSTPSERTTRKPPTASE